MDAGGRATQGAVAEGKSTQEKSLFESPHPSLLPEGEGAHILKSTVLRAAVHDRFSWYALKS